MGELANITAILLPEARKAKLEQLGMSLRKKKKGMTYDVFFFEIALKACYGLI